MRGTYFDIIALALQKGGEFTSEDTEMLGWNHTLVLLMCLPVFFTFLAYAGILFYEVATKKELISSKPVAINTAPAKYVDTGANPTQAPAQASNISSISEAHQGQAINPNFQGAKTTSNSSNPNLPIFQAAVSPQLVADAQKDSNAELYLWEELLIYMVFHIVGLTFSVQPAIRHRDHNAVGVIIAWLHMALIVAYAFVAVVYRHPDKKDRCC